jgi:hypothetical protein
MLNSATIAATILEVRRNFMGPMIDRFRQSINDDAPPLKSYAIMPALPLICAAVFFAIKS